AVGAEHVQGLRRPAERRENAGEVAGGGGEIGVERVGLLEMGEGGVEIPAPLEEDAEVLLRASVPGLETEGVAVRGLRLVQPPGAGQRVAEGVAGGRVSR